MKQTEIVGHKRANLGKRDAQALRHDAMVPCVLYGGEEQVHFAAPMFLFRDVLFTPNVYVVLLNIQGTEYRAILQDVQFHPVSDIILHADFLLIREGKEIKVSVPVRFTGAAPGVLGGGKLSQKMNKIRVQGMAENIPDFIDIAIDKLELGKTIKIGTIVPVGFKVLESASNPIVSIEIPRALRGTLKA